MGRLPGKPLQHLHRRGITEPLIQVIPIVQRRPLVALRGRLHEPQLNFH